MRFHSTAERKKTGKMSRNKEFEDPEVVIAEKCSQLVELLKESKCTMVYTGAGISTAAKIPDYRGPNGLWTMAEKGIVLRRSWDPVQSNPTVSHMVLKEMLRNGIVSHILSQNCDGLHLRSGVPQNMLSEIHGNMYIEVCQRCKPPRQFVRPFDVTQNSSKGCHSTERKCTVCKEKLSDTIVHFQESSRTPWPMNWGRVFELLDQCELILCVGTSLTVLKNYPHLWPKAKSKTKIVIVNLQKTSKDRDCALKINAKCDVVFEKLAKSLSLSISCYCRDCDPVLNPRRNARIRELREKMTDCRCHMRVPRKTLKEEGPKGTPGWWVAGIQRKIRRKQVDGSKGKRSVGRPRKRKNGLSVCQKEVKIKAARLNDGSSVPVDCLPEQCSSTKECSLSVSKVGTVQASFGLRPADYRVPSLEGDQPDFNPLSRTFFASYLATGAQSSNLISTCDESAGLLLLPETVSRDVDLIVEQALKDVLSLVTHGM